ncbi:MAG TPA: tetratricopeptide repeat protein [Clostridia bacterium]|nr:tetratricopeptide repeat protein [Clostridia bacterium]
MRRIPVFCSSLLLLVLLPCGLASAQNPAPASGLNLAQIQEVQPAPPRPPVSLTTATPQELEARGDELRDVKDYLQAIDYYNAAIRRQPTAVLQNKIGMAYISMQRYDKAQDALKRAIKMNKTYAEAYNNLGVVYHLKKKYGPAVKNYRKALELNEQSASFHSNLGTVYIERKEYEKGTAEYQRAFDLDPSVFERSSRSGVSARMSSPEDRARFNYLVARLYAKQGNLDKSLLYLRRAMEEGFPDIGKVYTDAEFATLRADQRFTELMAVRPPAIPQ